MTKLHLASASVDITPLAPMRLHASKFREPHRAVADPLEATIVVLREDDEAPLALVTVDALSAGEGLRKAILAASPDLQDCRLLLGASHTHFAPALDADLARLGNTDPDHVDRVTKAIADMAARLSREPGSAVDLRHSATEADCAINRRRLVAFPDKARYYLPRKQVLHFPNPGGDKSETIHVVLLTKGEAVLTAIWSYACHPVSFPLQDHASADYIGVVRRALRERFGPIPIGFYQGFSGDIRPEPQPPTTLREWMMRLLYGSTFGSYTPKRFDTWSQRLTRHVTLAVDKALSTEPLPPLISTSSERRPIAYLQDRPSLRPDVHFQCVNLSKQLGLMSCSAEVTTGYRHHVQPESGVMIPIGYTDHVYGYLPTRSIRDEGGYEADGFRSAFDLPGRYVDDVEERIAKVFRSLQP